MGVHVMKKKLMGSLLCAALCLLLCGMAAADTMVSDDGCWRFSVDGNITKVTAFYPTAAAAGQYYRNAELTFPATLKSGGDSYSVHAIDPEFSGAENARKINVNGEVTNVSSFLNIFVMSFPFCICRKGFPATGS